MDRRLDMDCPVENSTLPDCDCPYEHWHVGIGGCCLDIHVEENGDLHVTLNAGDWDADTTFRGVTTIEQARPLAFAWAGQQIGEPYAAATRSEP